jgi:hypothetical protein
MVSREVFINRDIQKLSIRKFFNYLWFVFSIIGILYSFTLFCRAGQPCFSNSCLIRLLFIPANKTNIEHFNIVYGTETSTNLTNNNFSKVLMFKVVYEMTFQKKCLMISRGFYRQTAAFIFRKIYHTNHKKKQHACNARFLTKEEFKQLMTENKFLLKESKLHLIEETILI